MKKILTTEGLPVIAEIFEGHLRIRERVHPFGPPASEIAMSIDDAFFLLDRLGFLLAGFERPVTARTLRGLA